MAPAWLLLSAVVAMSVAQVAVAQLECAGYECPDYDVISTVRGDVEIRRYRQGQWVKYPVPSDDFTFMAEYGNERLSGFFLGDNYDHQEFNRSTPLTVEFNVWDHSVQRFSGYWIPLEEEDLPPAPVPPARIDKVGETFLFAKKYNDTMDFRTVCRNIAMAMVDLAVDQEPFIMDTVSIAMYSYPKEGGGKRQEDEIWITRSFEHWDSPDVPVLEEMAANISRAFTTI